MIYRMSHVTNDKGQPKILAKYIIINYTIFLLSNNLFYHRFIEKFL